MVELNPPGRRLPYKIEHGCSSFISGVKKAVLLPLRVFSFKRFTVEAIAVHFRILHQRIRDI